MNDVPHSPENESTISAATKCVALSGADVEVSKVRRPRRQMKKPATADGSQSAPRTKEASLNSLAQDHEAMPIFRWGYRQTIAYAQRVWRWLQARREWQMNAKRLNLCETVSLGDKRFLAIVQVDGQHFLVGGAPSSVSMLAQLNGSDSFATTLQQHRRSGRRGA